MRIGFFSPLPPARSGIADYSAALLDPLQKLASVSVFEGASDGAPGYDIAVYQIGNNSWHVHAYEQALREPGVVVLHESNLHHLITDLTIRRGDWDAYLREVRYEGDDAAVEHAERARTLVVGPDYEGVPMIRRLIESARGVIVHSRCVEGEVRAAGYQGPTAVIPHGAWIPDADRAGFRARLGLAPDQPLIGIFGFLKPYKRIAESLRAFRRLVQTEPQARLILVGEPHPVLPLASLIDSLGIAANVRVLGYTPIDDFVGYLAASDIVLNLRYPTVGESSGTLLRSLGLGKAVIVSDVGSFAEYPDEICLKAPVDDKEEDTLLEYLQLLIRRPDLRNALGRRAHDWVQRECSWDTVARRYLTFLEAVRAGATMPTNAETRPLLESGPDAVPAPKPAVEPEYVVGWTEPLSDHRDYVKTHLTRLARTLEITPRGGPARRILEMGAYLQITPSLHTRLGYGEVRGCYFGPAGVTKKGQAVSVDGERFECEIDLFDAEKDLFPYANEYFDTVLCCELLEHLPTDPMHMMAEINRILKPGGSVVITTPNIASLRAVAGILQGYHPGFFPAYIRPPAPGAETDPRHNREYAPREIAHLLNDAGFELTLLETGPFRDEPRPDLLWVEHLLEQYQLSPDLRGDGIYAVGKKTQGVRERFPAWLYSS